MSGGTYLRCQAKRALRVLPQMLGLSLLLLAVGMLLGQMLTQRAQQDESKKITRVGVVADRSLDFIDQIFDGLENFDASRFALEFVFMEEKEALERLRAKELSAYIVVPDDFVISVYAGNVNPVRYVTLSGASGTTAQLVTEVAQAISRVFLEAESALVGARRFVEERLPQVDADTSDWALADRYTALTLSRDRFYRVELLGYAASLSTESYYFCGIGTLFLMLWAISCSPLFSRRSRELCRVLGSLLPAGVAIRSFTGIFSGEGGMWVFAALYALGFLALSVLLRRYRLSR